MKVGVNKIPGLPEVVTRSSAVAERPRDASYHWIFC